MLKDRIEEATAEWRMIGSRLVLAKMNAETSPDVARDCLGSAIAPLWELYEILVAEGTVRGASPADAEVAKVPTADGCACCKGIGRISSAQPCPVCEGGGK